MLRFDFTGLGQSGGNFADTNFSSNVADLLAAAAWIVHQFADQLEEIEVEGEAQVMLAGRPFIIKEQFLDDIQNQDIAAEIEDLDRALMIFHSPQDRVVDIKNASHIYVKARHPFLYNVRKIVDGRPGRLYGRASIETGQKIRLWDNH